MAKAIAQDGSYGAIANDRNANWLYIMVFELSTTHAPKVVIFYHSNEAGPLKTLFSPWTCRNLVSTVVPFDYLVPNMYDGRSISRHI
jgi:hypothetical protein